MRTLKYLHIPVKANVYMAGYERFIAQNASLNYSFFPFISQNHLPPHRLDNLLPLLEYIGFDSLLWFIVN
jgi:hypothetical protein